MNSHAICYIGKDLTLITKWSTSNIGKGGKEGGGFKFFCQRAALATINFLGNRSQTNIKYKQINVGVFDRNHQSAETNWPDIRYTLEKVDFNIILKITDKISEKKR